MQPAPVCTSAARTSIKVIVATKCAAKAAGAHASTALGWIASSRAVRDRAAIRNLQVQHVALWAVSTHRGSNRYR